MKEENEREIVFSYNKNAGVTYRKPAIDEILQGGRVEQLKKIEVVNRGPEQQVGKK